MPCGTTERKIERSLERQGYPAPKAEHIAKALVYGPNGKAFKCHGRR